eukprot:4283231-Karenia_brevis.AAC.1
MEAPPKQNGQDSRVVVVVHMMLADMVDQPYSRADTKSLKTAYWNVHEEHQCFKDEQHAKKSKHNSDASAGVN